MTIYIIVGVGSGVLFGLMDAFIHANPLARKLFRVFEPSSRKSMNIIAGVAIDLIYGFALAGIYLLLRGSLPFGPGILKGLFYGLLIWFFRVAMQVAAQWMMYEVPGTTLLYTLITGLVEMLVLGSLYGLTLMTAA